MNSTNSTSPDSGDKNCYQFLFKLLGKHYPFFGKMWQDTYKKLKEEATENGKNSNIHWKQIFNRLIKESLRKGTEEMEWKTLTTLLEMVSNIENYLTINGRDLIKWRDKEGAKKGKQAFISKCKQIRPTIVNLLKVGVEKNESPYSKQDFYSFLEENLTGMMDYENSHNFTYDYESTNYENTGEEYLFHQNPSKKMRTEDFTYNPTFSSHFEDNLEFINNSGTKYHSVCINEEEEKNNDLIIPNTFPQYQNSLPYKENQFFENNQTEKQLQEENSLLKAENKRLQEENNKLKDELERMRNLYSNFELNLNKNMDNLNFDP